VYQSSGRQRRRRLDGSARRQQTHPSLQHGGVNPPPPGDTSVETATPQATPTSACKMLQEGHRDGSRAMRKPNTSECAMGDGRRAPPCATGRSTPTERTTPPRSRPTSHGGRVAANALTPQRGGFAGLRTPGRHTQGDAISRHDACELAMATSWTPPPLWSRESTTNASHMPKGRRRPASVRHHKQQLPNSTHLVAAPVPDTVRSGRWNSRRRKHQVGGGVAPPATPGATGWETPGSDATPTGVRWLPPGRRRRGGRVSLQPTSPRRKRGGVSWPLPGTTGGSTPGGRTAAPRIRPTRRRARVGSHRVGRTKRAASSARTLPARRCRHGSADAGRYAHGRVTSTPRTPPPRRSRESATNASGTPKAPRQPPPLRLDRALDPNSVDHGAASTPDTPRSGPCNSRRRKHQQGGVVTIPLPPGATE